MARRPATRQAPPPPHGAEPAPIGGPVGAAQGVVATWQPQSNAVRILRGFLGGTFLFAGFQKLMDPNFLHAGSLDYIGSQLKSFSEGSPISGLLRLAGHAPVATGIGIALVEIAVGLGTLLGIAPVTSAAVGLGVNVVLFLSATWHVHPYFLGSDSIYAVAWCAYLVALVEARRRAARAPVAGHRRRSVRQAEVDRHRREFLRAAFLGVATVLIGGVAKAFAGPPAPTATRTGAARGPSSGTPVATLDSIPVGGAIAFSAPGRGPCVLLRPSQNSVEAYSRICTHAGCLVDYDQRQRILFCPCHGAEFDPSHGAQPIAGPAPSPLPSVPVAIDHRTGKVVVTT